MNTESVAYTSVDGAELEGVLVSPGPEPRPGVLIAHAWMGQSDFEREKAAELARLGYVGFAADVYGTGVHAESNEEAEALMTPLVTDRHILRHRIGAALDAMRSHPAVDASRVAAIGYCFGGLTVLEMVRAGMDIRGVVSFHGLLMRGDGMPTASGTQGKVLVLHGYDDPFAPPEHIDDLASEMTEAGIDWQLHIYGGTVHAFTNPAAANPEMGAVYHADADRRSWAAMEAFLAECLA